MSNEKRQSIGAWKKQTSKGEVINFTINGQKYSMWANGNKKTDKHPDFNIVEDNYQPQQNNNQTKSQPKTFANDDDSLPF